MVKSVDTLVSGTSARKGVQVRVLFWALLGKLKPLKINIFSGFLFKFIPLFIPHRIFIYLFRIKKPHPVNSHGLNYASNIYLFTSQPKAATSFLHVWDDGIEDCQKEVNNRIILFRGR